ncbi:chaperone-modulator protein CbpM [compost metagenome]
MLEYEIIQPQNPTEEQWNFDIKQLQRLKTAIRLQRDLEVNLAGVALVLDLLEEMERLKSRTIFLEQQLDHF